MDLVLAMHLPPRLAVRCCPAMSFTYYSTLCHLRERYPNMPRDSVRQMR